MPLLEDAKDYDLRAFRAETAFDATGLLEHVEGDEEHPTGGNTDEWDQDERNIKAALVASLSNQILGGLERKASQHLAYGRPLNLPSSPVLLGTAWCSERDSMV